MDNLKIITIKIISNNKRNGFKANVKQKQKRALTSAHKHAHIQYSHTHTSSPSDVAYGQTLGQVVAMESHDAGVSA